MVANHLRWPQSVCVVILGCNHSLWPGKGDSTVGHHDCTIHHLLHLTPLYDAGGGEKWASADGAEMGPSS